MAGREARGRVLAPGHVIDAATIPETRGARGVFRDPSWD